MKKILKNILEKVQRFQWNYLLRDRDLFLYIVFDVSIIIIDIRSLMLEKDKILLKQKDYELISIKSAVEVKISACDPLINPPKKGKKKKKQAQNLFNPLNRISKMPEKIVNQVKAANNLEDEGNQKVSEGTPWDVILKNFEKVYDIRKEKNDLNLTNVFGSQGTKVQEQLFPPQSNPRQSLLPKKLQIKDAKETKQNLRQINYRTYLKILSNMRKELQYKWSKNDKVASVQVTIRACKLLHDTSHAKFHALKFAYVMEIIQEFGINVFTRIKKLSFPNLSDEKLNLISIKDLEGANIPESAQQICRNWINKISSIRELIPRIFIQATLIRLYFFLDNGINAKKVLKRLAKSNRCFGQYINCIFFCTFLIRMGRQVLPQDKDYILDILDDVFFYIKQGKTKFNRPDISYDQFFNILEPFFVSSFESLAQSLTKDKFKRFCNILPQNPHPVILKNFIMSFSPSLLVSYSIDIVKILQKVYKQDKFPIYKLLFERLAGVVFRQSGEFIMTSWTDISQITQLQVMLDLLQPFSEIIFCNLPRYEKNRFYSLILDHFNNLFYNFRKINSNIYISFQNFLTGILQKTEDITDILTLEPFLQIITYFPVKNKREISENITTTFLSRDENITDPVIVHIMLSIMKNMQGMPIKNLVLKFLSKIDFQDDFEQTLTFLTQMRATFGYIPQLTVSLIYRAAGLTFSVRRAAKGKLNKKMVSFLQATLAYCYITVPVLENNQLKLKMYLYLSEIALANNLISQATSLIKTSITQLADIDIDSDIKVYEIFFRIISFLIVMPDDPETDYLFLFNGLLHAFDVSKLKSNYQFIIRFQFYTDCLVYLSCQAQDRLPFHIQGVVSNDGLFKNQEFQVALVQRIHEIVQSMQKIMKKMTTIEGNQIDYYIMTKLSSSVIKLLGIFEKTVRVQNLINQCLKCISRCRDRLAKDSKNTNYWGPLLGGLKKKLAESGFQTKIGL